MLYFWYIVGCIYLYLVRGDLVRLDIIGFYAKRPHPIWIESSESMLSRVIEVFTWKPCDLILFLVLNTTQYITKNTEFCLRFY